MKKLIACIMGLSLSSCGGFIDPNKENLKMDKFSICIQQNRSSIDHSGSTSSTVIENCRNLSENLNWRYPNK